MTGTLRGGAVGSTLPASMNGVRQQCMDDGGGISRAERVEYRCVHSQILVEMSTDPTLDPILLQNACLEIYSSGAQVGAFKKPALSTLYAALTQKMSVLWDNNSVCTSIPLSLTRSDFDSCRQSPMAMSTVPRTATTNVGRRWTDLFRNGISTRASPSRRWKWRTSP